MTILRSNSSPKARQFIWRQHAFTSALLAELAQSSCRIELGVAFLDSPIGHSIEERNDPIALYRPGFLQYFVTDSTHVLALDLCEDAGTQCQLFLDAISYGILG